MWLKNLLSFTRCYDEIISDSSESVGLLTLISRPFSVIEMVHEKTMSVNASGRAFKRYKRSWRDPRQKCPSLEVKRKKQTVLGIVKLLLLSLRHLTVNCYYMTAPLLSIQSIAAHYKPGSCISLSCRWHYSNPFTMATETWWTTMRTPGQQTGPWWALLSPRWPSACAMPSLQRWVCKHTVSSDIIADNNKSSMSRMNNWLIIREPRPIIYQRISWIDRFRQRRSPEEYNFFNI